MRNAMLDYVINALLLREKIKKSFEEDPDEALRYITKNKERIVSELSYSVKPEVSRKEFFRSDMFKQAFPDLYDYINEEYDER